MRLRDMTALVTGAAKGIGKSLALRLAREGCELSVCDIDGKGLAAASGEIKALGRDCIASEGDVSCGAHAEETVEKTVRQFGKIDILVNNAGIITVGPVGDLTEDAWDRTMAINLKGAFLFTRAASGRMAARRRGRIINISSKSGKQGGLWLSAYCASKFGLIGLTQSAALDLAEYGITVNAVCPGMVLTPAWDRLIFEYARKLNMPREKVIEHYRSKIPLGRDASGEDVGNIVVFLASEEASYMTGQAINITGGQEMR